jgi:hypothetical protein
MNVFIGIFRLKGLAVNRTSWEGDILKQTWQTSIQMSVILSLERITA